MTIIHTTAGRIRVRPINADDCETVHDWVTDPRSRFWDELDSTLQDVAAEITRLTGASHEAAFMLERDGTALAMTEIYDPAHVVLTDHREAIGLRTGDLGMHLLCAPPRQSGSEHGLTSALMAAVVAWLFDAPTAASSIGVTNCEGAARIERILVEPDERNEKILAKNALAGFRTIDGCEAVALEDKTARIQALTRSGFLASPLAALARLEGHLTTGCHTRRGDHTSERVERKLVAKALRELVHERIFTATQISPTEYTVDTGAITVRFNATAHPLEHLSIDPDSVRTTDGNPVSLTGLFSNPGSGKLLDISPSFMHVYLEEISATLAGRSRVEALERPSVEALCDAASTLAPTAYLQYIESAMVEGHPGFIANSGRSGFSESDSVAYAPELGRSTGLMWVAVRRNAAVVASVGNTGLHNAEDIMHSYLGNWQTKLQKAGLNPDEFIALPLHPWQWENKVTTVFADSIAHGDLICLGEGEDLMHPQQSLRTFFNLSRPELPYIKTAVAVRNMGFTRGLSPKYMSDTPAINAWLGSILDADPDFRRNNVRLLKEVASVGFTGDVYHRSAAAGCAVDGPHQKMIAALWRESPIPMLAQGRIAVTLAAALHTDPEGTSLAGEWIRRSGMDPAEWLARLLDVYLRPAVRALAEYGIAFMPHSENVILELDNFVPSGSFFKDLGEEVSVLDASREVPEEISRIQADDGTFDNEQRALSIHTDIFDGVLRHLGALLSDAGVIGDAEFWDCVRICIEEYWEDYPDSGSELPLLAPDFRHSCLNRLQLRNPETMVNLGDQNSSLLYAGRIDNPAHSAPSVAT